MEKKEEKENEGQSGRWLQLVLPKINSVPAAKRAWKVLVNAGFSQEDQEEIAEYLFRYCGGTNEQLTRGLRLARRFREEFETVIDQLRSAAGAVERIIRELRDIGGITIHDPRFNELPSILREFADELKEQGSAITSSTAKGTRLEEDGRVTGGRSENLSILVDLLRDLEAAKHEPYAFIAPLVAAVRGDPEANYTLLADALRNAVERYRKDAWPETNREPPE